MSRRRIVSKILHFEFHGVLRENEGTRKKSFAQIRSPHFNDSKPSRITKVKKCLKTMNVQNVLFRKPQESLSKIFSFAKHLIIGPSFIIQYISLLCTMGSKPFVPFPMYTNLFPSIKRPLSSHTY